MEELEDKIENIIRNEVFIGCFSFKKEEKGKKILNKLYLQFYHSLKNMETKRLILYNLIYAERTTSNNEKSIQKWVKELKYDMDKDINYKYKKTGDYCDMLSYYCDCNLSIPQEKLLQYYNFCYKYYKESYETNKGVLNYIYFQNMEFNIYRVLNTITDNFEKVLNIIEDLHMLKHNIADTVLKQILNDIKKKDEKLYKKAIDNIKKNTSINVDCIK